MSSAPADLLHFSERGSGKPLLLVHGLMVTGEMFDPVVEALAARHRVIIPDLRGHGRSRGLPPPYTAPQLAADLARLLDYLAIDSTAVLGYSHGGAVAQQLVLDYPRRCERLVLVCSYAYNMATRREWVEGHVMPPALHVLGMRRLAKLVVGRAAPQLGSERTDWLAVLMADQDAQTMASAWKAAMAFDSKPRLAEIACPTLIIAAANDQAVPFHHAKMLHDGIPGSRLVVIDSADHALIWTHPDVLGRLVGEFLGA
ncbi:alpha/beta fold hydrolase [Arthrobacter sp. NPDC058130]|uniref:alpha/beta fold hydrolase n=1 Tax=Arthrobacter sp. NPDC058130 TaxID=3346353 RepID=UPI0036E8F854